MTVDDMRAALAQAGVATDGLSDAAVVQLWAEQTGPLNPAPEPELSTGGFDGPRRELADATFEAFGRDARWGEGGPLVRVRYQASDREDRMDRGLALRGSKRLQVRSWEIAKPVKGQRVTLLETETQPEQVVTVFDEPARDERGVWMMGAKAA